MWELGVLELLIAAFLLLPLIRPFIKRLWPMDGLQVLPLLALGAALGLFPAYDIRPDCVPLLVYVIILNIANLPALSAVFRRLKNDDFRDRGPLSTGLALVLLAAVTSLAVYFLPSLDLTLAGARTAQVRDTNRTVKGRSVQLFLRIYETSGAESPLLVLIPPAAGSLLTVDRLCEELAGRGFRVLAYSRKGVDAPAVEDTGVKRPLSPVRNIRLLRAIFQGTGWAGANTLGRALEDERKQDLLFLLRALKNRDGMGDLPVFIAGFGAGGAAAISLAASPGFAAENPAVRGIIGLESPILSALRREPAKTVGVSREEAGWLRFFWANLGVMIANWMPRRVTGLEPLPLPEVPALYILSDRALYARSRKSRYTSVQEVFRNGPNPAVLAMVPGAGPLDYSDVPEKYPLMSLLFPGAMPPVWAREDYRPGTASLIVNFAAALAQTGPVEGTGLHRRVLDRSIYIDTNRAWNLTDTGYILGQ